uniref:Eukaryotic elongation factor 2 lysine methyltransferase n=2 Tax=Canis lupus familiaris TaxID=9615 RepID=A0A8I3S209_CANLF
MPGAFSRSSSESLLETRSRSLRAQPSFPTAPPAWSHGTLRCTSQNGPYRTQPHLLTDVLYCPETVLSLVRVLQRLSACLKGQQAPDAYVAFTVRNPQTYQLFTSELGQAGIPWEAVPHHDQKLFPYEEHSDMAILKLML